MTTELPYGSHTVRVAIPWGRCLGALDVADVPAVRDVADAIRQALSHPIGINTGLDGIVKPGETIAILVSDSFRQTRADQILPVLVEALCAAGVREEDILVVFATGVHRPPRIEEQAQIVGPEFFSRFRGRFLCHDPYDDQGLAYLGETTRGTPVRMNREVCDCDTGAVVLHYFAGYGGGRKAVLPGVASEDCIAHNHAMNLDPEEDRLNPAACIGRLNGNPVSEDMLEGARMGGVDLIVNTVLNRRGEIAAVFAGELDGAHRAAARFAHDVFAVYIEQRADFVVAASASTKNFVQTHKALYNAYQAVKPSGRVLLLAPCPEGLGGEPFVKWLRLGEPAAIFPELRRHSEINGQTALSTLQKGPQTLMVTSMDSEEVAMLKARKAGSVEEAVEVVRAELLGAGVGEPTFYVMPSAAYSAPFMAGERF